MSSIVLLSALSIPIISTTRARAGGDDENKPKTNRLSNLLRVARAPTRESLLKDAVSDQLNFETVHDSKAHLFSIA